MLLKRSILGLAALAPKDVSRYANAIAIEKEMLIKRLPIDKALAYLAERKPLAPEEEKVLHDVIGGYGAAIKQTCNGATTAATRITCSAVAQFLAALEVAMQREQEENQ